MELPLNAVLRVVVFGLNSVSTITLNAISKTASGRLQYNTLTVVQTLTSTLSTKDLFLNAVELVSYSVVATGGTSAGQAYCVVTLGSQVSATYSPVATLSSGPVNLYGSHSWDGGTFNGDVMATSSSFSYQAVEPAAGANFEFQPTYCDLWIDSIRFRIDTDLNVANRKLSIPLSTLAGAIIFETNLNPIVLALSFQVFNVDDCGTDRAYNPSYNNMTFSPYRVRVNERLGITVGNLQAGDQLSDIYFQMRLLPQSY